MGKNQKEPKIRYVNFDLSTEELKKHFGNNTAKAYEQIKSFFLEHEFEHRQYSSYISKNPLDDFDFNEILEVFALTHTWIKDCLQGFDILNVENTEKINATEQLRQIATDEELRKLTKIQTLTQKLDREVIYYEKSKNSFTKDAKMRVENTIISLCNELMQNGEIIKDKNLKTFQAIIIERNGGRKI